MLWSLLKGLRSSRHPDYPLEDMEELPYHDPQLLGRHVSQKAERLLAAGYLEWPAIVHMETIAICNAACDFCPYPTLERKGERMSDTLIEKIIRDLGDIPPHVKFQLAPYKVSDPFLEPRLFDILERVNARLPNARISIITNGAALTERNISRLCEVKNLLYLSISINYDNAEEYEAVMKIPFARTVSRLDQLHQKNAREGLPFPVRLTRVSDNMLSDSLFMEWAKSNYPDFSPRIAPRNDWLGQVATGTSIPEVPDVPCHRWFDMSITATGKVAMCCMDGEARYPKGDVTTTHVLDIYNQPHLRRFRKQLISRRSAGDPCSRCTYLSY
jgi:Radical SAM superfamily/Iron-sulfur cluster-binding domain